MKTVSIKIIDAIALNQELTGESDPQGGLIRKGILHERLQMKTKYWLTRLQSKAESEIASIEKLRVELITKYGEKDEAGGVKIAPSIKGKPNKNFLKFQEEYSTLLNEKVEIEVPLIRLEDLDFESDNVYPQLFNLVEA